MKLKPFIFIFFLFVLITAAGLLYLNASSDKGNSKKEVTQTKEESNSKSSYNLNVAPQTPGGEVIVESATVSKASYLVIRELVDGKLGQVIEISAPIKAGTHTNVPIPIGNADIKDKELIVMIYDDQSNDGNFNDFDQPTIDENGSMIARYVKTGKPLAANLAESDAPGMMGHNMAGMASMEKVKYTDKGFVPEKLEVPGGSMVEFVNESSTDMWVASAPHPQHTDLPTFDQFKPTKKGTVYRYVFDKKGQWKYHDHINPSLGGVVTVK